MTKYVYRRSLKQLNNLFSDFFAQIFKQNVPQRISKILLLLVQGIYFWWKMFFKLDQTYNLDGKISTKAEFYRKYLSTAFFTISLDNIAKV